MTEKRRAPIEVLERLAEAMLEYTSNGKRFCGKLGTLAGDDHDAVVDALAALRAATAPLRTRAAVDAEIATLLREDVAHGPAVDCLGYDRTAKKLRLLCSEPTSEEPAPPIDTSFPEPCSCDEALHLKERLRCIRAHTLNYEPGCQVGALLAIRALCEPGAL